MVIDHSEMYSYKIVVLLLQLPYKASLSVHEKEEFITYNTEIYFPALNLTPIE